MVIVKTLDKSYKCIPHTRGCSESYMSLLERRGSAVSEIESSPWSFKDPHLVSLWPR